MGGKLLQRDYQPLQGTCQTTAGINYKDNANLHLHEQPAFSIMTGGVNLTLCTFNLDL